MDPLTVFGVGATIWTALHFIPSNKKLSYDDQILETWKQCGVINREGLLPQKQNGAWFLPYGLSLSDVKKSIPALSYQLNAAVEVEQRGKAIYVRVFPGSLPELVPYEPQDLSKYKLGLVIGRTHKNPCYIFDLNDTHYALIISGAPGQGKSNAIKVFLRQMAENYGPDRVQWYLIDLKLGVELFFFEKFENTAGVCWKSVEVNKILKEIQKQIKTRMELFKKHGVLKIDEYNALPDVEPLPYLLLVIDEYAELKRNKEAEGRLQSILQTGRASGVRCLLCLQRASATNLSTDIRGLIADRLTFRVPDRTNSEIILDTAGAEELPCPGRCLLLHGAELVQSQVMRC